MPRLEEMFGLPDGKYGPGYTPKEEEKEPKPDVAKCSSCGWSGNVSECKSETDGSYEEGYYQVHLCPECKDGGCIDDYEMSEDTAKEWNEWHKKQK